MSPKRRFRSVCPRNSCRNLQMYMLFVADYTIVYASTGCMAACVVHTGMYVNVPVHALHGYLRTCSSTRCMVTCAHVVTLVNVPVHALHGYLRTCWHTCYVNVLIHALQAYTRARWHMCSRSTYMSSRRTSHARLVSCWRGLSADIFSWSMLR